MSVLGIIAEYNPFHNGHKYQIEKAKELSGCDHVVIIMSGNYVQRGIPSIYPKYDRAVMAAANGADLVIELPVVYSASTAQLFAYAAVKTLMKSGIVDYISFGCENDSLPLFYQISDILINEPEEFKSLLKNSLSNGNKYAKARQDAIRVLLGEDAANILNQPNNILALEYIKAIREFNYEVGIIPVKRKGSSYNSLVLNPKYSSATSIRNTILSGSKSELPVPENVTEYVKKHGAVKPSDFNDFLMYALNSNISFEHIAESDMDLSNKISKSVPEFKNISDFSKILLSKDETESHILRVLLHIMLNITSDEIAQYTANDYIFYFNILASSKNGIGLLSKIKESSDIPVINRFGKFYNELSDDSLSKKMLKKSAIADRLYDYVYFKKYSVYPHNDYLNTIFK